MDADLLDGEDELVCGPKILNGRSHDFSSENEKQILEDNFCFSRNQMIFSLKTTELSTATFESVNIKAVGYVLL